MLSGSFQNQGVAEKYYLQDKFLLFSFTSEGLYYKSFRGNLTSVDPTFYKL